MQFLNETEVRFSNNIQAFFELVRAGLWGAHGPVSGSKFQVSSGVDWNEVYRLATEQSVLGLVLAGLEHSEVKPPKELLLQWIGEVQMIEQRNKAMNAFVAILIERLRVENVYTILVKGQGIAQCYERPLWRACGDVDFFLNEGNYKKAFQVLCPSATSIDEENVYNRHLAMTIDGWAVELHGTLRSGLWRNLERELDKAQKEVFYGGKVRSWLNGTTQVLLPGIDEDVLFVFSHIIQHFYFEGIGLRQICDWCRLLYTYRDTLNHGLLESRIRKAGLMSEWKAFAAFAVKYLGMTVETIPFYSYSSKWKRKASRVLDFVIETGNFGHNRDYSYYKKYPYLIYKVISLCHHIRDTFRYSLIFPLDSLRVMWSRLKAGVGMIARGK